MVGNLLHSWRALIDRGLVLLAVLALVGYAVAFEQAQRGNRYYEEYVDAYRACFSAAEDKPAATRQCNQAPAVRAALERHRRTYAVGDNVLNGAVFLTTLFLAGAWLYLRSDRYAPRDDAPVQHTAPRRA